MRRPAEQTKLLFLYFLRSTAAALSTPRPFASGPPHHALTMVPPLSLFGCSGGGGSMAGVLPSSRRIGSGSSPDATRPVSGTSSRRAFRQASAPEMEASPSSSSSSSDGDDIANRADRHRDLPLLKNGHLTFRLARRTDVPQIQKCNLATLPENYNPNFYVNHMRTWPELCLVAEHVPGGDDDGDDDDVMASDDVVSSPWEFYSNIEQYPTQRKTRQKEIVDTFSEKSKSAPSIRRRGKSFLDLASAEPHPTTTDVFRITGTAEAPSIIRRCTTFAIPLATATALFHPPRPRPFRRPPPNE